MRMTAIVSKTKTKTNERKTNDNNDTHRLFLEPKPSQLFWPQFWAAPLKFFAPVIMPKAFVSMPNRLP